MTVDLDNGTLTLPTGINIPTPPAPVTTLLSKQIGDIIIGETNENARILEIKNAFYMFFLKIFEIPNEDSAYMTAFRKTSAYT